MIEAETINRRDPETGVIKKHRRIRLPVPDAGRASPIVAGSLLALSTATPGATREAALGWPRTCPDCGDVGTVTLTTVSCKGCGQILSTTTTEQTPESEQSPMGPVASLRTVAYANPRWVKLSYREIVLVLPLIWRVVSLPGYATHRTPMPHLMTPRRNLRCSCSLTRYSGRTTSMLVIERAANDQT